MVSRIEREHGGVTISQVEFYREPTIAKLAEDLRDERPRSHELLPRLLESSVTQTLTLVCCPYAGATATVYMPLVEQLRIRGQSISVFAVAPPALHSGEPVESIEQLAESCVAEILQKVQGPIAVYGHCVGSFLALEIVRQLERRGRPVRMLIVGAAFPFHRAVRFVPAEDPWHYVGDRRIHACSSAGVRAPTRSTPRP